MLLDVELNEFPVVSSCVKVTLHLEKNADFASYNYSKVISGLAQS